jgi:hypothetical protein
MYLVLRDQLYIVTWLLQYVAKPVQQPHCLINFLAPRAQDTLICILEFFRRLHMYSFVRNLHSNLCHVFI